MYVQILIMSLSVNIVRNWVVKQVALFACAVLVDGSYPGKPFFSCTFFFTFLFVWHHVCFHNRVALGPDMSNCSCAWFVFICAATVLLYCCCYRCCLLLLAAACCCLLLLAAAVRHRVPHGKICCWFIEPDSSVFVVFI